MSDRLPPGERAGPKCGNQPDEITSAHTHVPAHDDHVGRPDRRGKRVGTIEGGDDGRPDRRARSGVRRDARVVGLVPRERRLERARSRSVVDESPARSGRRHRMRDRRPGRGTAGDHPKGSEWDEQAPDSERAGRPGKHG
jgi:hypothetical protein